MQVYDLGPDGKDLKRVAEVTNFAQAAERAAGGRDIFGGRSSADRKVSALTLSHPPAKWLSLLYELPHHHSQNSLCPVGIAS